MTKLLVASGNGDSAKSVEIINLDEENPNLVCFNLPKLRIGVEGATGQLIKNKPLICGGVGNECRCQEFQDTWHFISYPILCRSFATSTMLKKANNEEDLLIIGVNFTNNF